MKEASAAPDQGDASLTLSEHDTSCKYCAALKEVNDPEEGDCPYCARNEAPVDSLANCKYCADAAAESECKYCNRPAAQAQVSNASDCQYCSTMEHRDNECQYCGRAPDTVLPTTTDSQNYAGQDLNNPEMPKPVPGEEPPMQVAPPTDVPTNNNLAIEGQGEITVTTPVDPNAPVAGGPAESVQLDHSKEALMAIAQQIEGSPAPQSAAQAVDSTQLAVGTDMQGNVSRPAGYGDGTPGDLGLSEEGESEEGPDMGSVLSEGLDSHAQSIQREKVVQMVSSALQGFKASKQIIERAQEQAPQLYNSSIMMLKAMIEMCKMLGLDQEGAPTPEGNPLEGGPAQPAQSANPWSNPFPAHPENGGDGKKDDGRIGQGVGKLPTSATTEHVAKVPQEPGSVNDKGQMRYVDPSSGKESYIDMKEGRVLNEAGKPVKPTQG
jgi:hypothetical protein